MNNRDELIAAGDRLAELIEADAHRQVLIEAAQYYRKLQEIGQGRCLGRVRHKTAGTVARLIADGQLRPSLGFQLCVEACERCNGFHVSEEPAPMPELPSRDTYALQKSCYTKRIYTTERGANQAARSALVLRGTRLRTYQCEACGWWHLTKKGAL